MFQEAVRAELTVLVYVIAAVVIHLFIRKLASYVEDSENRMILTNVLRTISILFCVLGVLAGLEVLGLETIPLLSAMGVGGIVLSFALQETLSNLFSGFALMVFKPYVVGDYVIVESSSGQNCSGRIVNINLSRTCIDSEGNSILVPNSQMMNKDITIDNKLSAAKSSESPK